MGAALDRRVAARLARDLPAAVDEAVARARDARLLEPAVWGPPERLSVAATADVSNAYLNTLSGSITIGEDVLFGHDVAVVAAAHDPQILRGSRAATLRSGGCDVSIGRGAHVGTRAVIVGPCRIGPFAVVADGAVVSEDVPAGAVVGGAPARILRQLGRERDLPPSVEADTDVGRMRLLLADEVITPALQARGRWEEDHADALRSLVRPGMAVVDVGANVGYTALVCAQAVGESGRVVAIEPHPDNVSLLRANAEANGAGRIEVIAAAAWRSPGTVRLAVSVANAGDHRTEALTGERRTIEVPAVRLDDAVQGRVDLIKLDTQGSEHVALEGARRLVDASHPLMLVEFWPKGIADLGDDAVEVLRRYRALGYRLRVLEEPEIGADADDAVIVATVADRPDPVGGFATLVLEPAG